MRKNVVRHYGAANAFERKLADGFDRYNLVNCQSNARANQNLTGLGFIAKS